MTKKPITNHAFPPRTIHEYVKKSNHLARTHKANMYFEAGSTLNLLPILQNNTFAISTLASDFKATRLGHGIHSYTPSLGTYSINFADPEVYQTMIATNKRKI